MLARTLRASASAPLRSGGFRRFFAAVTDAPTRASVSAEHWDEQDWPLDALSSKAHKHVMTTWGPGANLRAAPYLTHAKGVYVYDVNGKEYLDWTSGAVCANLGHSVPEQVKQAVQKQLDTLAFSYSGFSNTSPRIRLASLLAELMPGDLNGFLFPTSGSEANEAAIRIARRFTGKTKIINQYRSYHGGTLSSLTATGDFRRNFVEGGGDAAGFVKTMNPTDSHLFSFGATDEERTANALGYLEEQIKGEGPQTIAAIMLESITGSAGVYLNPPGYMEGVRALCDKYNILLICDEVMVGFGRTGKMWGFQHYDILPDIVTSAKGLTGAYFPLSMVACRQHIMEHFETNPLGWGSTFQAHPVTLAAGYECVKYFLEQDVIGHVKKNVEPVMREGVNALKEKYASVSEARVVGAFGCVDLINPLTGLPIQDFSGQNCSKPEAIALLKAKLVENGLLGFVRPPKFHCAPPLIITPEELREGFRRADRALEAYDGAFR